MSDKKEQAKTITENPVIKLVVEQPATQASLEKVKYQDLLETFTVLGIPEIWKPGSSRTKMISRALERLSIIRDLKNKGLEGEALEVAKLEAIDDSKKAVEKKAIEEAKEKEIIEEETQKKEATLIKAESLTIEQANRALKVIESNLKNASKLGRSALLTKRKSLQIYIAKGAFKKD